MLYLVRLFYPYADPHAVDAGLNEDFLILVSRYSEGVEENFGAAGSLDLRYIVPFGGLRCEV